MDGLDQITGAAIVEEEEALPQSPEGSRAELIGAGTTLIGTVGQTRAHVVQSEVRVRGCK